MLSRNTVVMASFALFGDSYISELAKFCDHDPKVSVSLFLSIVYCGTKDHSIKSYFVLLFALMKHERRNDDLVCRLR